MIQLLVKKKHGSSLSSSVSWMWCQVLMCSLDDKTNSCLSCCWQLSKAVRVCQHNVLLCLVDYWILLDHCQRSSSPYRSPTPLLVCKLTTHLFLAVALLWQIHFSHTFALTNCECPIVKMQALCGVFSIRCIFCCILRGTCVCHWYCCLLLPTVYYCYSLRSCWPGALSFPPAHLPSPMVSFWGTLWSALYLWNNSPSLFPISEILLYPNWALVYCHNGMSMSVFTRQSPGCLLNIILGWKTSDMFVYSLALVWSYGTLFLCWSL